MIIAIYRHVTTVWLWNCPGIFQSQTIEISPNGQANLPVPVSLWEAPFPLVVACLRFGLSRNMVMDMKNHESMLINDRTAMRHVLEKCLKTIKGFVSFAVREKTGNFPMDAVVVNVAARHFTTSRGDSGAKSVFGFELSSCLKLRLPEEKSLPRGVAYNVSTKY